MLRLLTIAAAKRDLKKALAGASWDCWSPNTCGKTNYINLCQINRKTHFQTPVCTPYSYFILSIKKKVLEYSGKYVCHDWLGEVHEMDMPCHHMSWVCFGRETV